MRTVSGNSTHNLLSDATAGAGGGKVGIAGALALTIADVETTAQIKSNAGRGPPGDQLHGGDLTLTAASTVDSAANASAKDEGAGTVGIGAGAAIHIVDDTTRALIAAGAAIAGAKDVTLTATGVNTLTSYAEAGTAAPRARRSRSPPTRRSRSPTSRRALRSRAHDRDADGDGQDRARRDADGEDDDDREGRRRSAAPSSSASRSRWRSWTTRSRRRSRARPRPAAATSRSPRPASP
jgi:hypothetical protein